MYIPDHFRETDAVQITTLVRAFPLACIVAQTDDGLVANHIPLLMPDPSTLIGHIARNNDMHRHVAQGQQVLVIFRGEDAYISPNLYPSKAETHRAVPTWNYQAAHIHGSISFQHDDKAKRAAVGKLTKDQETQANGADAWRMSDAPSDYMADMLENIVAFRIVVQRVLAKSKISQNRSPADLQGVHGSVEARDLPHMAAAMRRHLKD